jgi:hypothetical protein
MNEELFAYFSILFAVIGVSYTILDIKLYHIFGLLLLIITLSSYIYYTQNEILTTNEELEYKMLTLLPKNYNYIPEYFYLEPDFILLFDSVKVSIGSQNMTSFYRMIKNVDSILEIKHNLQQKSCSPPINPDILLGQTQYIEPNCENSVNKNCEQEFVKAKSIMSDILNYGNSLILVSKTTQTTEWIHINFMQRLGFLLKRTLNEIKVICNLVNSKSIQYKIGFQNMNQQDIDTNFNLYLQN